jgi:hypothetical protein
MGLNRRNIKSKSPASSLLNDDPASELPKIPELSYLKGLYKRADKAIDKLKRLLG